MFKINELFKVDKWPITGFVKKVNIHSIRIFIICCGVLFLLSCRFYGFLAKSIFV